MICPKCRKWIPDGSRDHKTLKCGWTSVSDLLNTVKCDCGNDAKTRVKIDGKWKSTCWECEENRRRAEAKAWCEERGLVTREDCLAFIKKTMRDGRIFNGGNAAGMREPGEDEDFRFP